MGKWVLTVFLVAIISEGALPQCPATVGFCVTLGPELKLEVREGKAQYREGGPGPVIGPQRIQLVGFCHTIAGVEWRGQLGVNLLGEEEERLWKRVLAMAWPPPCQVGWR